MHRKRYDAYVRILKKELVPASGCTEPIAIAYAAAKAREVLEEFPTHISMYCSGNIIKNVQGVTVPNSRGMRGIEAAATLGVVGGDASRELEVLESVTDADVSRAAGLVHAGFCDCTLQENVANLYIVARAEYENHYSEVTIINRHTLITKIVKDGEVLYQHDLESVQESSEDKLHYLAQIDLSNQQLKIYRYEKKCIYNLLERCDIMKEMIDNEMQMRREKREREVKKDVPVVEKPRGEWSEKREYYPRYTPPAKRKRKRDDFER